MLNILRSRITEALHGSLCRASKPPFGLVDALTYTKNWLAYMSLTQSPLLGEEFPSADANAAKVYPRDQCELWDVRSLPHGCAHEHSVQSGLWIIPNALSEKECKDVIGEVEVLTQGGAVQGRENVPVRPMVPPLAIAGAPLGVPLANWAWYEYERARWMVPLQPSLGVDPNFALTLRTLQSHGCTDAHTWPLLSELSNLGGVALRAIEVLPIRSIEAFARRTPLFLQLQALQRGAPITPHIDEPDYGGRAIATVLLQGPSDVRVGGVIFRLVRGDMYCLTGAARDSVDHEVFASEEDRLSVTVRYSAAGPMAAP